MSVYSATVCLECGGSGEIETPTDPDEGSFDLTTETGVCEHCAGTGWEPPSDA